MNGFLFCFYFILSLSRCAIYDCELSTPLSLDECYCLSTYLLCTCIALFITPLIVTTMTSSRRQCDAQKNSSEMRD
jgi:hypothetical protein